MPIGKRDLSMNDSPEIIVDRIVETVKLLKMTDNNVVLSAIVPRVDKLKEKAEKGKHWRALVTKNK